MSDQTHLQMIEFMRNTEVATSAHHPGESLRRQRHHLRCGRSSREASGKAHRRKDVYVLLVP